MYTYLIGCMIGVCGNCPFYWEHPVSGFVPHRLLSPPSLTSIMIFFPVMRSTFKSDSSMVYQSCSLRKNLVPRIISVIEQMIETLL